MKHYYEALWFPSSAPNTIRWRRLWIPWKKDNFTIFSTTFSKHRTMLLLPENEKKRTETLQHESTHDYDERVLGNLKFLWYYITDSVFRKNAEDKAISYQGAMWPQIKIVSK